MALSNSVLKGLIVAELLLLNPIPADLAQMEAFAGAIANAVVAHITSSAQVIIPGGSSAGTYPVT